MIWKNYLLSQRLLKSLFNKFILHLRLFEMKPIGRVKLIKSPATVIGADGGLWHLYKGNTIYPHDRIYVARDNSVTLSLINGDEIRLEGEQSWTPTEDSYQASSELLIADITLSSSPKGESNQIESLLQQALAFEVTSSLRNLPKQSKPLSKAKAS